MNKLLAVLLLYFSTAAISEIVPYNGLWTTFDDPEVGSGIVIDTQGEITLVSVFTYDSEGKGIWYIASGGVINGVFESPLYRAENGTYLILENPDVAELVAVNKNIKLVFEGNQLGVLSIDDSQPKKIQPKSFGFGLNSQIPDLTGQWIAGNSQTQQSFILDLTFDQENSTDNKTIYSSDHYSSKDWQLSCEANGPNLAQQDCHINRSGQMSNLSLNPVDIGFNRMVIEGVGNEGEYQAFRFKYDLRSLPHDGYWRTYDDPVLGSGMLMVTQGELTVFLLYSYGNDGKPIWQIASGQFDQSGKLEAQLNSTFDGTSIESEEQNSATVVSGSPMITIQMLGSELATISIDGSAPKHIQKFNFGSELMTTEQFKVVNNNYQFPNAEGKWVVVDHVSELMNPEIVILTTPNEPVIPVPLVPPLMYQGAFQNVEPMSSTGFDFECHRTIFQDQLHPTCQGTYFASDTLSATEVLFQDIGYHHIRVYGDPEAGFGNGSFYLDLFRVE